MPSHKVKVSKVCYLQSVSWLSNFPLFPELTDYLPRSTFLESGENYEEPMVCHELQLEKNDTKDNVNCHCCGQQQQQKNKDKNQLQ